MASTISDVSQMETLPPGPALRKRRRPRHRNLNIITVVTSASRDYADPQVHRLAARRSVNLLLSRTRRKIAFQHRCLQLPQDSASSQTRHRWNKSCLAVLLAFPNGPPPMNLWIRNNASAPNVTRAAECRQTTGSIRRSKMPTHLASHVVHMTHGATWEHMTTAK